MPLPGGPCCVNVTTAASSNNGKSNCRDCDANVAMAMATAIIITAMVIAMPRVAHPSLEVIN